MQTLAGKLQLLKTRHITRQQPPHQSEGAISSRARDIARSALNLSDNELDEFFSDSTAGGGGNAQESSFVGHVESLLASKVKQCTDRYNDSQAAVSIGYQDTKSHHRIVLHSRFISVGKHHGVLQLCL